MIHFARRHLPLLAGLAGFLALYAVASLRYDGFLSLPVFVNLLTSRTVLAIVAVGAAFVILSGGIDLSVGAVMSLSSIVLATLLTDARWPLLPAIVVTLALGVAIGLSMGVIIHFAGLKPFIVTLAGMFFARGLGYLVHYESVGIRHESHASIANWSWMIELGDALVFVRAAPLVLLAAVCLAWALAALTPFGRAVYAIGGDEEAARLMGVRVGRSKAAVYGISGLCSALGGVILTFELGSGSHIEGVGLELDAIAAVVVGGTLLSGGVGSIPGTLIGALTLGIVYTAVTTYETGLNSGLTKVFIGLLLLLFVLVQRTLSGRRIGAET